MFLLEELRSFDRNSKWNPIFQMLNLETRTFSDQLSQKTARLPSNRNLNRYRDVLPYDNSRIVLQTAEDSDYINANLIEVPSVGRKYILTQGPLPNTCGSFWRMIWEQKCRAIVMLNKIIEKNSVKCHPYWPLGEDEVAEFEEFRISNKCEDMASTYVVREFTVKNMKTLETRLVKHFHYLMWPDFGVPNDPSLFLAFLNDVRSSGALDKRCGPLVVHCSAGIGRSGTFCLVDAALLYAENKGTADGLDLQQMLLEMRRYRCGLIQTAEQLRFAYLAVIEGLTQLFPSAFEEVESNESATKRPRSSSSVDDEPPPLPPRATKSSVPPPKPPRVSLSDAAEKDMVRRENEEQRRLYEKLTALESSDEGEADEEVIDLSSSSEEDDDIEDSEEDSISPRTVNLEVEDEHEDHLVRRLPPEPPEISRYEEQYIHHEEAKQGSISSKLEPALDSEVSDKSKQERDLRSSLDSRREQRGVAQEHTGIKASENAEAVRQRRLQRNSNTRELVSTVKRKMVESEKAKSHRAVWMRAGVALGICAGLLAIYKIVY